MATDRRPAGASVRPLEHPLPHYWSGDRERPGWVRSLFDRTAVDYDRIECMTALGCGSRYRREALERAGLAPGMRVLDVAVGTGLVAREAVRLTGDPSRVIGVDPSEGMLRETRRALAIRAARGMAEHLPFADDRFDFLSMGFALRHVADLDVVFREYLRVLRPGGTACIMEITRPQGRAARLLLRAYMRGLIPFLSRFIVRQRDSVALMRFYWDTIEACAPPATILDALRRAGFADVRREVSLGVFSEYTGRKPA